MIEATGDLWTFPADFRVITTNGSIRNDGRAVMGRGCAREAAQRYRALPTELGTMLKRRGNRLHYFEQYALFTFPVKHVWPDRADLELIRQSTDTFARQILRSGAYVMPRAGCGNGGLRWADVQPILATLPDNVTVIDYGQKDRP